MMHFNIFFPFKEGAGVLSSTGRRIPYRNAWPPEGWHFVDFHIHSCRGPPPGHGMLRLKKKKKGILGIKESLIVFINVCVFH